MTVENPYQAPKAVLVESSAGEGAELAGRGQRFGAALVDGLIGMVGGFVILYVGGTSWESLTQGKAISFGMTMVNALASFIFFLAVHGYFLKTQGQTVGKKVMDIRIVDLDDKLPLFPRLILRRYLPISLVSLIPVVGGLLTLVDILFIFRGDRRCVHDLIAGTRVIQGRGRVAAA